MGCKEIGHSHSWPTDGVLVIQRCEIRCNFCKGDKALKPWKYAWFLRRHVRAVHCKGGKGENYSLDVSTQWKGGEDRDNDTKAKPKKSKVKHENEDDNDEDENDNEVAAYGAVSRGNTASTTWVPQPTYLDVPDQFPGMVGGFQHVNPRDIHFDQSLAFGDQDLDTLIDHQDIGSFFNPDEIFNFLSTHSRSLDKYIDDGGVPKIKADADENENSMKLNHPEQAITGGAGEGLHDHTRLSQDADFMAHRSAVFYAVDEETGEPIKQDILTFAADLADNDRYFMPDYFDSDHIEDFWSSDEPLAQVLSAAYTHNTAHPAISDEVLNVVGGLDAVTEYMRQGGVSSAELTYALAQYTRVLELRVDAEAQHEQREVMVVD